MNDYREAEMYPERAREQFEAQPKTYQCQCHVCGDRFQVEAEFLSASSSVVGEDGVERQKMSCGKHTSAEIRAAWLGANA